MKREIGREALQPALTTLFLHLFPLSLPHVHIPPFRVDKKQDGKKEGKKKLQQQRTDVFLCSAARREVRCLIPRHTHTHTGLVMTRVGVRVGNGGEPGKRVLKVDFYLFIYNKAWRDVMLSDG